MPKRPTNDDMQRLIDANSAAIDRCERILRSITSNLDMALEEARGSDHSQTADAQMCIYSNEQVRK